MVLDRSPEPSAADPRPGWKDRLFNRRSYAWSKRFLDPLFLGAIAVLIAVPVYASGNPWGSFALESAFASIFIMLALAWDFSSGMTGYLNFGLPFFFGVGAFVAGYMSWQDEVTRYVPFLLAGAFAAGLACGVLFAIPTLRLRGPYFTLLSFLLPLLALDFVQAFWWELNMPSLGYWAIPFLGSTPEAELILLSVANGVFLAALCFLRSSHFGLVLRGIRDDEDALLSQGISTFPYKVVAFTISSGVMAFAGASYAMVNSFGGVDTFGFFFILFPVLIAILGGTGELYGAVFAGYFVYLLYANLFPTFAELTLILFVSLAILLVLFLPHGLVQPIRRFIKFMRTEQPS